MIDLRTLTPEELGADLGDSIINIAASVETGEIQQALVDNLGNIVNHVYFMEPKFGVKLKEVYQEDEALLDEIVLIVSEVSDAVAEKQAAGEEVMYADVGVMFVEIAAGRLFE